MKSHQPEVFGTTLEKTNRWVKEIEPEPHSGNPISKTTIKITMTNPNKVGLVAAALLGGWHLLWSLLVLVHWAQPFIDFIFWAHMIQPIYVIKPFDLLAALTLILITAAIGYGFGFLGATIWNKLHR
jgi:hypothetical protein